MYKGKWVTTANRKLDGEMTCVITYAGKDKWHGHFYGIWQGVEFDYMEKFTGPALKLVGKATIDGAHYDWKGTVTQQRFKATFTGDRYTGYFELKRVLPKVQK